MGVHNLQLLEVSERRPRGRERASQAIAAERSAGGDIPGEHWTLGNPMA